MSGIIHLIIVEIKDYSGIQSWIQVRRKVIEAKVNEVIAAALPVTTEDISREEAASSATASMNGYGQLYKFRLLTFPTIPQPIA